MSLHNETDLQTDACPSPPRNLDSPITNDHNDDSTENVYHKHSKSKPSTKPRSKAGKSNASNVVTMVNINNSKKIHVGDVHKYNISDAKPSQTVPEPAVKLSRTEAVNSMLTSWKPVEEQHMDFVSGHVTVDGWMNVAQSLDFSMGQIQQLNKRCESRGIREVVYNMLVEWKQKEPTMATLGKLGTVLWNNGEQEAASRLANKLFSTNN